jgi:hypothetical protein
MHEWMHWLLAPFLAHAGMVWLALAMPTHWQQVRQTPAEPSAWITLSLRFLAVLALSLSLLTCLWLDHPSMAVLVWVMWLSVAAVVVTLGLAWRPQVWRLWLGRLKG